MKKISTFQYNTLIWFIIRACFLENIIKAILYSVKEDSYIAVLIGSLLGLIPLLILEYIKNKAPNISLIKLNKLLFKTDIVNILILTGSIIINISTFWILIHFANSLFLYKTSLWIISLALIIPIIYASSKEIHIIAKVSQILFYISVIITTLIMVGLIDEININNINPILQSNPSKMFYSSVLFTSINTSKIFFLSLIPKNKVKNYKKKNTILFYLITCLSLIEITITIICIFGIDLTLLYEYPAFQILKRVNLLGYIDRLETILSVESLFSLFINITLITNYTSKIIKSLNKKISSPALLICIITYLTSNILFFQHEAGEKFISNQMIYINLITLILLPLIILLKLVKNPKIVQKQKNTTSNYQSYN